jgi:hypothetical protein
MKVMRGGIAVLFSVAAVLLTLPAVAATFDGLDLNLVGTSELSTLGPSPALTLTPSSGGVGAAWLTTPVSTTSTFVTTFSFDLSSPGGLGMADGFALVFHNAGTSALGSGGGNIGVDLPDTATAGGAVAAELQTFWNTYGIVQNTDANGGPFGNSQGLGTDLSGTSHITGTETVTYDPVTHTVSQTMSLVADGNSFAFNASAIFDLQAQFGPTMTVGLTGATGGGVSNQVITSWTLTAPVPEPESYAMMLAGLGLTALAVRRRSRMS